MSTAKLKSWSSQLEELSGLVLYQVTPQNGGLATLHLCNRESYDRTQEWVRDGETWHDAFDVCCRHLIVDIRTGTLCGGGPPYEMCPSMLTDKELAVMNRVTRTAMATESGVQCPDAN